MKSKIKKWITSILNQNVLDLVHGSFLLDDAKISSSSVKGKINADKGLFISGATINADCKFGQGVRLTEVKLKGFVEIGNHCKIINGVDLDGAVYIGNYTSINGPNTDIKTLLNPVRIGSFCSIARNVTFQEYNHDYTRMTTYLVNLNLLGGIQQQDVISNGEIIVGNDVWIGSHAVILSGAKIGTGSVIAANSVVTGEIPPYAIAAGSPAKVIKYRFDEETIKNLLASEWWLKPKEEIVELYKKFGNKT